MEKKELFFKWLEERGALGLFINAFAKCHPPGEDLDHFLENNYPGGWIDAAFTWSSAPNPHIWITLQVKWSKFYSKEEYKYHK